MSCESCGGGNKKCKCCHGGKCVNKGGKIIGKEFELKITKALATLELQHNKYLANLPIWYSYLVWTYTLGSQPVNRRLVGVPVSPKSSQDWTYQLFNNFMYGVENVGKTFKKYTKYFKDANLYKNLPDKQKEVISQDTLNLYTIDLQGVILGSPPTIGDIITYKASTPYDAKLVENNFPFTLKQTPFNSTTYDPWFDFNSFLGSNQDVCCLWQIHIPKGSHILAISHPFQAYLTEREVLLPVDSEFKVVGYRNVEMSYYENRDPPIRTQGDRPFIGELYRHDNWENRVIRQRNIRLLEAFYSPPY